MPSTCLLQVHTGRGSSIIVAAMGTVQRRGFRFVATLTDNIAIATATTGGTPPSIAVLPFVDMRPSRDQEHFCFGMAEEIIHARTRTTGLHVAAHTSSFAFKNRNDDVRTIAGRVGVATVLEGSVRLDGDRFRVTTQLIDAGTGFHLWSERWERQVTSMFDIQDEIACDVVSAPQPPGRGDRAVSR
ncbi:MAG: hypothetical protein KJ054_06640 [Gammaproteobacteria bacterium]|nr:hypothetical protein [Gammaproteobacteria bacterium]